MDATVANSSLVCQKCGAILAPDMAFCPHCGAAVTNKPLTVGLGKQLYVYGVSLLLPPFGLIWTWKYFRSGSPQAKKVGWVALILTAVAIFLTVWMTIGFLQGMQTQLNSVSNYTNYGL